MIGMVVLSHWMIGASMQFKIGDLLYSDRLDDYCLIIDVGRKRMGEDKLQYLCTMMESRQQYTSIWLVSFIELNYKKLC